jgi:protein-L-isoaspartate(D-aspartate) O-methyltransferase
MVNPVQDAETGAGEGGFSRQRRLMVDRQLVARGIRDGAVLRAFRKVPREAFLPRRLRDFAYDDSPLPIGEGQTISQPYIVARMVEALRLHPGARVLEIGAGSGYAAAILAEIAAEVCTVERHASLAVEARERLERAGYASVKVVHGDGSRGYEPDAPYDGIVVAAGAPAVPESLRLQLAVGGRLVIPVGRTPRSQMLVRVTRESETGFRRERLDPVRFVPLVGEEGWSAE